MEELLSDAERRRIIQTLTDAVPREGRDRQLSQIIKKLSGTDAVISVVRVEKANRLDETPVRGPRASRGMAADRAYPKFSRGVVMRSDDAVDRDKEMDQPHHGHADE